MTLQPVALPQFLRKAQKPHFRRYRVFVYFSFVSAEMGLIMKNIFLCGFMGCGKTTVAKALAILLDTKYIDMDKFIENEQGQSVSDIFRINGEAYFRELETKAAEKLSQMDGYVVSTGGGAVISGRNVAAFKSGGIIVFIDVPLEVIKSRLEGDTTRPLLKVPDKDDEIRSLYIKRMPFYRAAADFTISNADNHSELIIAKEIIAKL